MNWLTFADLAAEQMAARLGARPQEYLEEAC